MDKLKKMDTNEEIENGITYDNFFDRMSAGVPCGFCGCHRCQPHEHDQQKCAGSRPVESIICTDDQCTDPDDQLLLFRFFHRCSYYGKYQPTAGIYGIWIYLR